MDKTLQQTGVLADSAAITPAAMPRDVSVCLMGGQRIVRSAIQDFLESQNLNVALQFEDETALAQHITSKGRLQADLMVLFLGAGRFRAFGSVKQVLDQIQMVPLVILSDQVSRGQIYTVLRLGAKAFVNLNADPHELLTAIRTAAEGRVYLSPEAAELLVSDISGSGRPSGKGPPNFNLSKREIEIIQLLANGLSSKEIARDLHLSTKTVENHRYNIYRKCEVDSIAGLIRHAIHHGLVSI